MSNADDLFERVRLAQDRDLPTIDELLADITVALDELERDFPEGKPSGADVHVRIHYDALLSTAKHGRWLIEHGQCVEFPRGRPSVLEQHEQASAWEAFVQGHPELVEGAAAPQVSTVEEEAPRPPLTFSDAELMRALRVAVKKARTQYPGIEGAWSECVADELAGITIVPGEGRVPKERVPIIGDVIRVGLALGRLARVGRVVRTNRKWEANAWVPAPRRGGIVDA